MASEKSREPLGSVLVVGGCGFLGYHIVCQLLDAHASKISVLDLSTNHNRLPSVSYHDGDISSPSIVTSVLEQIKPDIIIHTASPTHAASRAVLTKVNVDGTRNLIERAGELRSVKAFIYTSSASIVHDNTTDLINADERWPVLRAPEQKEYYPEAKGIAESIVLAANRKYGKMLTCSIRPAAIFGEADVQMIPGMLTAYEKGQTRFQLGDNTNLFDFTYVGNVAHAHILAAKALIETYVMSTTPLDHEKVDGEAFFITNDAPVYFWDFARMVWKAAGDTTQPSAVWVIPTTFGLSLASFFEFSFGLVGRKPNLTRQQVMFSSIGRYYNINKAKRRLGYTPIVELEEAVEKSVRWFMEKKG